MLASLYSSILCTPSFCKSLKFFMTWLPSPLWIQEQEPAFSILSAMFTGAFGLSEKLSLTLVPCANVLRMIVKLAYTWCTFINFCKLLRENAVLYKVQDEVNCWYINVFLLLLSYSKIVNDQEELCLAMKYCASSFLNPLSPNGRSTANFSFQLIASYVWYSVEFVRWSLVGVKVCLTTNSPNTVHTLCSEQVGRIKVKIFVA